MPQYRPPHNKYVDQLLQRLLPTMYIVEGGQYLSEL
jgi:hypothetical protein